MYEYYEIVISYRPPPPNTVESNITGQGHTGYLRVYRHREKKNVPRQGLCLCKAKVTVRGGLVLAGEGQTANPLEFGGDRKTIGKL